MSARFDRTALDLAANPTIERVARQYTGWGQDVVVIEFQGEEWGRLDASMNVIVDFLVSLQTA